MTPLCPQCTNGAVQEACRLQVERAVADAILPSKGSDRAAGYDLYASEEAHVAAGGKALVSTGLRIKVPTGTYGRIAPRSGLAWKHHLDVGAGVVDEDYRGEVKVVLFNLGPQAFLVRKGERIAQLICEKIEYPEIEVVQTIDETRRGQGGFGSTGR